MTDQWQSRKGGPFSPEGPPVQISGGSDFVTPRHTNAQPQATEARSRRACAKGVALYERGTERMLAKAYWAERERFKDVVRREEWSECTFHPHLSAYAVRLQRPRSLSPENRYKAERMHRLERIEAARRAQVTEELDPCTFQPLTLRAASLSPFAPIRSSADVHEAMYRVAETKQRWARQLRPRIVSQLMKRIQHADPEYNTPPKLPDRDIEGIVLRLLHPDAPADGRATARSRSRSNSADGVVEVVPKPRISAVSEKIFDMMKQERNVDPDVLKRLTADIAGLRNANGDPIIPPASTEDDTALRAYLDGGTHQPKISKASEHIVRAVRERHLKGLFGRIYRAAESLKSDAEQRMRPSRRPPPDLLDDEQTARSPQRPPLGRSEEKSMTLIDFIAAIPMVLSTVDGRHVEEVLRAGGLNAYTATSFYETCLAFSRRMGPRPFMNAVGLTSGKEAREVAQHDNHSRLAREAAAQYRRHRSDAFAEKPRGDWVHPRERREPWTERTKDTVRRIKEFNEFQELKECTFKPKLNTSNYIFVRRSSASETTPPQQHHQVAKIDGAADQDADVPPPRGRELPREAPAVLPKGAVPHISSPEAVRARSNRTRPRTAPARPSSYPIDPARIPARTVMTARDVHQGSITEAYLDGGHERLQQLGVELMQQQLRDRPSRRSGSGAAPR